MINIGLHCLNYTLTDGMKVACSRCSDAGDSDRFAMARLRAASASRSGASGTDAASDLRIFFYFIDDAGQTGDEPQTAGVDQVCPHR